MNKPNIFKETNFDGVSYICPTWEQMGETTFSLAKQIIESGRQFDRIIALAKGGWTWARALADFLQITKLSSTRLKSYDGVNECSQVKVLQPLSDSIDGERILIFDDVVDSGETIAKAKEYMTILGAKEISTAALCFKPRSKFVPEFYAFSSKSWVIFPHECREFIDQTKTKWLDKNLSSEEIKSRLKTIGIPSDLVDYFVSK